MWLTQLSQSKCIPIGLDIQIRVLVEDVVLAMVGDVHAIGKEVVE